MLHTSPRSNENGDDDNDGGDDVVFAGHTDIGLTTILFNIVGGLQVLPAGSTEWEFILPEPGCVVVQLGDTLAERTGGVLRSAMHR